MMKKNKQLIINSDDFGISKSLNDAVFEGFNRGVLTQTSLLANGDFFQDAIERVIPNCKNLAVGVHLNTYEGKALTNCPDLTDKNGFFDKSFVQTLLMSFNKKILAQIKEEWEAQILKVINSGICPSHLDSHVHYHSIPNLFKIALELADKYGIKYIRTQREKFYTTKVNSTYVVNILKNTLLNLFTYINKRNITLKTNDYLIGVLYTSMMCTKNVEMGLNTLPEAYLAEILIHPKSDETNSEYKLLFDDNLKKYLKEKEIVLTNYEGAFFDVEKNEKLLV